VNALALGPLRQFNQWLWIDRQIFQLGGEHFTTELMPPAIKPACVIAAVRLSKALKDAHSEEPNNLHVRAARF